MGAPQFREFKFKIRVYETDYKQRLKIDAIANYMQECAEEHAKLGDLGYDGMMDKNIFWVLSKVQIQILEMPIINDEITIKTWSKGLAKLYAIRDFEICNGEGKIVIRASTNWLVIDSKTYRPVRPNEIMLKFPHLEQESLPINIKRLNLDSELDTLLDQRKVRYSDIDVNNHVNNARYLTWITDAYYNKERNGEIKNIEIDFLSESKIGDNIRIFSDSTNSEIAIKNQDDKVLINAVIVKN